MLQQIRKPIEDEMLRFEEERAGCLGSDNPLLALVLSHVAKRQGKMMRPMLALLMAGKGTDSVALRHAALALELLHTASLVHDDVVDQSDRRRGQASVNALFDNRVAVLSGDYILSLALAESARTASTPFVQAVAALGQQLSDGELLQLHCMDCDQITEEQYYEVIRRKTASLFATCAAAASILDGTDSAQAYLLGELIGMAFQMRDDIFDLVEAGAGKPAGNDLREGKLTLPVIHAVQCNDALLPAARRVRRGEASAVDIDQLAAAARSVGIEYATAQMAQRVRLAHSIVDAMHMQADVACALHTYIDYTTQRNK